MDSFYTIIAPDGQPVHFEFDKAKSLANKLKHGIDFVEAQRLWQDLEAITAPARDVGEERFVVIGMVGDTCWSAILTHRGERIRLISVRRSRPKEVDLYERRGIR